MERFKGERCSIASRDELRGEVDLRATLQMGRCCTLMISRLKKSKSGFTMNRPIRICLRNKNLVCIRIIHGTGDTDFVIFPIAFRTRSLPWRCVRRRVAACSWSRQKSYGPRACWWFPKPRFEYVTPNPSVASLRTIHLIF